MGGGQPKVPEVAPYNPPSDGAAEAKAKALEAKRKRASTILTSKKEEEESPMTSVKTILGS